MEARCTAGSFDLRTPQEPRDVDVLGGPRALSGEAAAVGWRGALEETAPATAPSCGRGGSTAPSALASGPMLVKRFPLMSC